MNEAAGWYEDQRTGLGVDFVSEVQRVFDEIRLRPKRYPIALGDAREAPTKRFPYCIYYLVKSDRIIVISVFNNFRDPAS